MGEIVTYRDLTVYLINEYSKAEHDYTEVLYRMRYVDEQLISIGKQESLKNFSFHCMPHIYFSSQEKVFLMIFLQEDLYAFLTCLTLCKNPFEYVEKIIKSSTDVYMNVYRGVYCKNRDITYILQSSNCGNLDFCINSSNYIEIQGKNTNFRTSCYVGPSQKGLKATEVLRSNYDIYNEPYIVYGTGEKAKEFMNLFIERKNGEYYASSVSCIDLFEKVLNKRIDIENLQKQYERKMRFFYED